MPAFAPFVKLSTSLDGKTVTITDQSNYADNTDGVTINNILVRTVIITDGLGNSIGTVVFSTGATTAPFNIPTDLYLSLSLIWTLANSTQRTGQQNYLSDGYYFQALIGIAGKLDCDCCGGNLCTYTAKALISKSAADYYYQYGQGANSQNAMTAADNLILN